MSWLKYLTARLRGLWRAESIHDEIDEEMRFHIDAETEANIRDGMPPEAARRDAERRFGNLVELRERGHDVRGGRWMASAWQDMRFGARVLAKRPGFTAVAVVTLALGVGANTAIFSVVDSALLRPLPYREPDRLVQLWEIEPREEPGVIADYNIAPANLADIRAQSASYEDVAIYGRTELNIVGDAEPERLDAAWCSPNLVSLLGVAPIVGRGFTPEESAETGVRAVALSQSLWERRFGSDPSIAGRSLDLDGKSFTVVGVLPARVEFPTRVDVWIADSVPQDIISSRAVHFIGVVARLAPGVTLRQAQAELDGLGARLEQQYPQTNSGRRFGVTTVHEHSVQALRPMLLILFAAVGLVLLIACSNVANLLLARMSARRAEIAVRAALGAGRLRLVRQLLTESVLLAFLGTGLGVLVAFGGVKALVALGPAEIERLGQATLDMRVLAFTLAVTLATGLGFGIVPALRALGPGVDDALKDGSKGAAGSSGGATSSVLVVSEVALSMVLLVAAGLLVRSFVRLTSVDPGIDPNGVLAVDVALSGKPYEEDAPTSEFFRQVCDRIAALPGVRSVGAINTLPLTSSGATSWLHIEGRPDPTDEEPPAVGYRVVSGDYFRTLEIPLVAGRTFSQEDSADGMPTVLVNEELAREFFAGDGAIGKRIKLGPHPEKGSWLTIVGVVGSVRNNGLDAQPRPEIFRTHVQEPWHGMTLVARVDGDPMALVGALKDQVWAVDAAQPVFSIRTMNEVIAESVAERRFGMSLLAAFAGLALLLAGVGLYSVIAYSVTRRTHEIGIRMALGARTVDVLGMVVRQGMALALAGVGVGLVAALALTRFLEGMIFGVTATDPATFAGIAALLSGIALVASYLPARRAARIDPMVALRDE